MNTFRKAGFKQARSLFGALIVAAPFVLASSSSFAGGDEANGEKLAEQCAVCHGADGNSSIATNPKLAGQHESYIVRALSDYRSGARESAIMAPYAGPLSDQDIRDLAAWFASQESELGVLKM